MIPSTIYFVVNEFGEVCTTIFGDDYFISKKDAAKYARQQGKAYRVLTYARTENAK